MGLGGSTCSESLPERTCHFQPPQHVPRTSAGAQTRVWGPGGLPVYHEAESTRKDPRPEEKKMSMGEKNTFMYMCKGKKWRTSRALFFFIGLRQAKVAHGDPC